MSKEKNSRFTFTHYQEVIDAIKHDYNNQLSLTKIPGDATTFNQYYRHWKEGALMFIPAATLIDLANIAADSKASALLNDILPNNMTIDQFKNSIFKVFKSRQTDATNAINKLSRDFCGDGRDSSGQFKNIYDGKYDNGTPISMLGAYAFDKKTSKYLFLKPWIKWYPEDLMRVPDQTIDILNTIAYNDVNDTYIGRITPPNFGTAAAFHKAIVDEVVRRREKNISVPEESTSREIATQHLTVIGAIKRRTGITIDEQGNEFDKSGKKISDNNVNIHFESLEPQNALASLDAMVAKAGKLADVKLHDAASILPITVKSVASIVRAA